MNKNKIVFLTKAGVIAACYVVITIAFAPFGFGEVQVRISEMLTILPIFGTAAIPGLFVGCIIGNIFGGAVVLDVIFGSIATLIGAVGTYLLRNKPIYIATIPPIVSNAVIVPFVLKYAYGSPMPIPLMMLTVGIGEIISCGVLGSLLGKVLKTRIKEI